jgi:hypothetical protein
MLGVQHRHLHGVNVLQRCNTNRWFGQRACIVLTAPTAPTTAATAAASTTTTTTATAAASTASAACGARGGCGPTFIRSATTPRLSCPTAAAHLNRSTSTSTSTGIKFAAFWSRAPA